MLSFACGTVMAGGVNEVVLELHRFSGLLYVRGEA